MSKANYQLKDLTELKPDKYEYVDGTYILKRFISKDKKILITTDGCEENRKKFYRDYVRVYIANEQGKGKNIDLRYFKHGESQHAYPFYTVESVLPVLNEYLAQHPAANELIINPSQYKGR